MDTSPRRCGNAMANIAKDLNKEIDYSMNKDESKDEPTFFQGKAQATFSPKCYASSYAATDVFASKAVTDLEARPMPC